MKAKIVLVGLIAGNLFFSAAFCVAQQEQAHPLGDYEQSIQGLRFDDRFTVAATTLLSDGNPALLVAAMRDLLDSAVVLDRTEDGLAVVDDLLARYPDTHKIHRDAFYTRARLLHRAGANDLAVSLFQEGMSKGWKGRCLESWWWLESDRGLGSWGDDASGRVDGSRIYLHSLHESDPPLYAVELFNRAIADSTGKTYAKEQNYLSILKVLYLWPILQQSRTFSAMEEICPRWSSTSPEHAVHVDAARAVCLMLDDRYDEAVDLLETTEAALPPLAREANQSPQQLLAHNERRNIPLYIAAARYLQGEFLDEARAAMQQFRDENHDRPTYWLKLMEIAYALRLAPQRFHDRATDVTEFLFQNLVENEEHRPLLSKWEHDHIVDMYMGCYFRQRKWAEARRLCERVVADYDPRSAACNNALFCLAHTYRMEGNSARAQELFARMLNEPTSDKWHRVAQAQLTAVAMDDPNTPLAEIEPSLGMLEIYAPTNEGKFYRYGSMIERFRNLRELR